jgi:hypothetical protein
LRKEIIFVIGGMVMINDDFQYYTANQEEIVRDHLGEYVVIKDTTVLGYFKEEIEAFESMKNHELGTFIVKKCQQPGMDCVTFYNSRVTFA